MPTFTITAPDGKRYKVTGATKEGALAALKSKLEGPQQPTQLQQQPQAQPQVQPQQQQAAAPKDTSMGSAFKVADAQSQGASMSGTASLQRNLSQGPFGQFLQSATDNYINPIREGLGFEPIDRAQVDADASARLQAGADRANAEAEKIAEDLDFYNMTTSDINSVGDFVNFIGQKTAQAAPYMGAALASGGTLTYPFAVGEISQNLSEIEGLPQDKADDIAAAGGAISAALETLGIAKLLPKGASNSILGGIANGVITEGTTEGLQELVNIGSEAVGGKQFSEGEILNRLKEAAAAGSVAGGAFKGSTQAASKAKSLFTSDGKLDVNNLDNSTKLAAGDVARELQQIATAEGFKLSNVDVTAQFGAKGALEAVREQNNGEITELVKALKGKLNSKNASSLDQVLSDFAPANAGIKSGKNKVSGYVSKTQMAALARLVGPYREGAALMNALAKSNVITGLFKDGMKGGISQFTDYFSPFGTSGAVYDPTRIGNIIVGGGAAAATMGQSVPIQAGIVGLGRLVDAVTGRRNKLSRFVNKNINAQGLPSPSGVSLVDKAKAAESDAKVRREALARIATQIDAPPNANSPVGTILSGTGLSRDGLSQTINSMAQDFAGQPELAPVLKSIQQNMDGDTNPVLELNEIIPIIGQYAQMTAPELIVATPDNPLLARGVQQSPAQTQAQTAAPSQPRSESSINADFDALAIEKKQLEAQASSIQDEISNLSLDEAQARKQEFAARMAPIQQRLADISSQMDSLGAENQARRSGNQFTTPENYQAGKSDNNSFARSLASQVSEDAGVSVSDKAQLLTALEDVQSSLGPDPVAALDEITTELQNIGVNRDVIDTYFKPYRDRVALQQARVGRMQAPSDQAPAGPTLDQSSVSNATVIEGAVRKIMEGNMDPASVEAMLNQLEQNNPGIKAKILDITGPQQQSDDSPRFARIAPVPFNNDRMQQMFGVEDPTPGGNYIDLDTKEDLTGNTYAGGKVSIVDGKPVLDTSDDFSEPATKADGRKVKVNLFKQKAGWKWIDYDGPATIVSTEVGGKHHYALSSDFQNPVTLQTYPNQPSEPRLRPTTQGEVELGNKIGNISVRGKIHPVYDEVRIVSKSPERPQVSTDGPLLSSEQNPLGIPAADLQATNVDYTPTPDEIEAMRSGSYKPEKKRTLVEAAGWLHDKWTKATGRSTPFEYTPENIDRISSLMATEAMQALKNDGNAIGWYDRKLKASKRVVSLVDPRVTQSPDAEAAFDYALAVTSNGQAVADNFVYALEVFRHFMDKGIMPTDTWIKGGERNIAMVEAFEFFNAYNASGQNMPIQEFLDSDFTVKELDAWAQQFNEKNGTNITVPASEGANELVKASFIVGPKIGQGFYQNIRGNYDPLTMDIWWMRMWNRLVGRPFESEKDLNKNRKRMREALKTKNQNDLEKRITKEALNLTGFTRSDLKDDKKLDEFVLKLDSRYQSFFTKTSKELKGTGKKVPKPETFQASGTMKRNLSPQLQATPKGPGERSYMRQVTKAAIQKLKENGFDITTADFQALMWYPEKQLFRKMGVAPGRGADNDYLDAAIMLAEQEGFTNDQINQALPSPDGDGAVGNQPDTEGLNGPSNNGTGGDSQSPESPRFNQQPTGVAGILAQRIQGSPNGPTARGAVPDVQEVKGHADHARALVEIGKPGSQYENGIKDQRMVEHLAKAVGVTLKMFNDHNAMLDDGGFTGKTRKRGEDAGGVYMRKQNIARSLAPGATVIRSGQVVAPFRSYLTALHEVAHGIAGRDIEGNLTQNVNMGKNYLTGNQDVAPIDTLEHMIGNLATMPSAKKNKIIKEIMSLQDNESFVGDGVYYGVRPTGPAKKRLEGMLSGSSAKKQLSEDITNFEKYSRSIPELTVDPLIVYLENPKKMKSVAPETAKAIRAFFVNSSKIRFYSHPLAMAFAVIMAMLMKQEQAEEEERQKQQQMAPGALTPPPGALTAA